MSETEQAQPQINVPEFVVSQEVFDGLRQYMSVFLPEGTMPNEESLVLHLPVEHHHANSGFVWTSAHPLRVRPSKLVNVDFNGKAN